MGSSPSTPAPWSPHEPNHPGLAGPPHAAGPRREAGSPHQREIFDHLVFKGGTALRKLYAGNAGRFSTDLDFSVCNPDDEPETVTELLRGFSQT
jgi:Nucleotidyl transferase AbiEii toxin, Type IV TA system